MALIAPWICGAKIGIVLGCKNPQQVVEIDRVLRRLLLQLHEAQIGFFRGGHFIHKAEPLGPNQPANMQIRFYCIDTNITEVLRGKRKTDFRIESQALWMSTHQALPL